MLIWLLVACIVTPENSTGKYDFINLWLEVEEAPAVIQSYEGVCGRFRDDGMVEMLFEDGVVLSEYCLDENLLIQTDGVIIEITSDDGVCWDALVDWNGLTGEALLVASCDEEQGREPLTLNEARLLLACP